MFVVRQLPPCPKIIRPTLNELSSAATVLMSADFSFVNLLPELQFAVLSSMMRTFGRSDGMFGLLRNRSVSSLTGSNTAYGAVQNASSVAASSSFLRMSFMVMLRKSGREARAVARKHPDLDALVVGRFRAGERVGHRRRDLPDVVEGRHRLGERVVLRALGRDAAHRRDRDLRARGAV